METGISTPSLYTLVASPLAGELNKLETWSKVDLRQYDEFSPLAGELNKLETHVGLVEVEQPFNSPLAGELNKLETRQDVGGGVRLWTPHSLGNSINWKPTVGNRKNPEEGFRLPTRWGTQ